MAHINNTKFGSVTIDDIKYGQVLIIGPKVVEREAKRLNELFGTTHKIGEWEVEELLKGKPEIVIIGTGQSGVLKVDKKVENEIKEKVNNLIIKKTPRAVAEYNKLTKKGKLVNALIHTTC